MLELGHAHVRHHASPYVVFHQVIAILLPVSSSSSFSASGKFGWTDVPDVLALDLGQLWVCDRAHLVISEILMIVRKYL
jgi:hypothetical protein